MTPEEQFEAVSVAQYMGIAAVFEHLVLCAECRKKAFEIVNHANEAVKNE